MTAPSEQPTGPASFKTLVYSPEVRIVIENTDVSRDLVRGSVNRITGGVSSLEFTLSNKGLRYNNRFRRMDRVVVFMKRISEVQVFAGYLDLVPGLQLYPSTVTLRASCTIKRIQYMYWDPYLSTSSILLNQFITPFGAGSPTPTIGDADTVQDPADAASGTPPDPAQNPTAGMPAGMTPEEWAKLLYPNSNSSGNSPPAGTPGSSTDPASQKDTGLGNMLKQVLNKVGGWEMDQILVQQFPESFLGYVEEQMPHIENFSNDAMDAFKKLFQFDAGGSGAAAGGGGLGDATFTTIGPPANGDAYSNEEIVWIVTNAGWSGEDVVIGSSIIKAESSGRPAAINTANSDGSIDRGLWQINSIHDDMLPGQNRFDPAVSTEIARMLYKNRGNWDDWSTLVYHGTAQQHFDEFRPLVAGGGTMPPGSKTGAGSQGNLGQNNPRPSGPTGSGSTTNPNINKPATPAPANIYKMTPEEEAEMGGGTINASMWIAVKTAFPNATLNCAKVSHFDDGGYHPQGKGVDLGGPMQEIADWIYANYKDSAQLIWGPGPLLLSGQTGHIDPNDQAGIRAAYGEDTMSGHYDHVHWGSDHEVGPSGGGSNAGGSGAAGKTGSDKLAKNIFTYQFLPETGGFNSALATLLEGRYASLNDEPLIKIVKALCDAGMREFMSSPTGDFIAFYPDYFGLDNTAPILKLEDVEMKNVSISINDDALTTHVFTMGANDPGGLMTSQDMIGYTTSPGTVTVEDEWLFKRATEGAFFQSDAKDAKELLSRFGVRPLYRTYPNIYQVEAPEAMLLVAIKLFMEKWAQQYQSSVSFTFMPELYPGMRVELVGHDLIVYVKSVTHNFDFESGFSTSAQVMAPMSVSRAPLNRVGNVPIEEQGADAVGDWIGDMF